MAGPSDNVFAGLALQVARAGIEIRGMTAIVSGTSSAFKSVGTLVSGQVVAALQNFVGAAAKAAAGLVALGTAALPGGFKVLGEVMDYLTAVIGSVATPIFVVIAAAGVTLADMLQGPMLEATKAVAEWLGNNLVSGIQKVVLAVEIFSAALTSSVAIMKSAFLNLTEWIARKLGVGGIADFAGLSGAAATARTNAAQSLMDLFGKINGLGRGAGGGAGGGDGFGGGVSKTFADNMRDVLISVRTAFAKQGNVGFSGILDVWKQVQMQSFMSPLERKKLAMMEKALELLEKFLPGAAKPQPAAVGP